MAVHKQICIVLLLSAVSLGHSALMKVTINEFYDDYLPEHIDGNTLESYGAVTDLNLDKLNKNEEKPSSLSVSNFEHLLTFSASNISLETLPVFYNVPKLNDIEITENRIKTLPKYAFTGVNVVFLRLAKNQISKIETSAFHSDVRLLLLRCNHLVSFSSTWFQRPAELKVLDLAGNQIEYLPDKAFEQFTLLSILVLLDNKIQTVGVGAFGSGKFSVLHLGFNDLAQISADMFAKDQVHIVSLYIDYNRLGFLSDELMNKLNVTEISLEGNPWQCPCLRRIEKWTRKQDSLRRYVNTSASDPSCIVSWSFSEQCVTYVDRELQETYTRALKPVRHNICENETELPAMYRMTWLSMKSSFVFF